MSNPAAEFSQTPLEENFELEMATPPAEQPAAEIIAITVQDDFLLELGEVIGGQAGVHPVESVAHALEYMSAARRAQILAIDARDIADLRDAVGRAYARVADITIVLFADAADVEAVTAAFRASKVGAVLPIPLDPARTALVFAAALADAVARFSAPPLSHTLGPPSPSLIPEALPAPSIRERIPREYRWALGAGLALLLIAAVPWFMRRAPQHAPSIARGAISAPAVQTPLAQGGVDELLEKARTAMAARRYTEPAENCALVYYRSAQAADPANAEAHDGLARVAAVLVNRFEDELRQSQLEAASATLQDFKSAAPQDARAGTFDSRLATAKARADLARREEQAQLKHAAEAAAQSAREELLQKKAREHAAALAATQAAQQQAEAARAREAEEAAAKAAAQAASAAQKASAEHTAAAPVQLKLTHYVMPDYPPAALAHNVSGSVTVGYTVDAKGVTRDVRVLAAEPAGVFDRDALDAVKQWRYAPAKVDDAAVAVPTRTVIQFKPQ